MGEIKKFLDEGLKPIEDALSRVTGPPATPLGLTRALNQSDLTTVKLDNMTLNTLSDVFIEGEKSEIPTGVSSPASSTVDIRRTPASSNTDAKFRILAEPLTGNTK